MMKRHVRALALAVSIPVIGSAGCATWNEMSNRSKGAVIGGAAGGAAGAVIGKKVGNTAAGAVIGAVVGGAAGAVIGNEMDKQAREIDVAIEGAEVQRVGEGIIVTFESGILYPFDSDRVLPAGRDNLRKLAESLQKYPNSDVLIVGHTDARGTDSYNYDLSRRRAASSADLLATYGISRARLHTEGRGESEPIATNETDDGRQLNRRVEIAIYASEAYRQQVQRQVSSR